MIFTELVLQNFGPYLGKQVIDLRCGVEQNPRPIILFGGMNGGGKTTLMDAIRLALYGQRAQCSTRGNLSYPDFLSQCINRNTSPTETTRIELAFRHIQGDPFVNLRIVRYWTKDLKDGKDVLGVLIDDEWPDRALVNTWDEFIENLLPLAISNLFLFDGEQVKELAEQDIPPPSVVKAIESLLGLELADRLAQDIDILVRRKQKNIDPQKQVADLDEIDRKLKIANQAKETAEKEKDRLEKQLKHARWKHRKTYDKFIYEGGKIAAERSNLDRKLTHCKSEIEKLRKFLIQELAAGTLPLALISPILTQAKDRAEKETRQEQAKVAKNRLLERDRLLLDYIAELSLDPEKVDKIKFFLERENQNLESEISEVEPWLLADAEAVNQLEHFLRYDLQVKQTLATEKLAQLQHLETELDFVERQIAAAASPEAYEQLEKDLKEAHNDLAKATVALETCQRQLRDSERAIASAKKELENHTEEFIQRENDKHLFEASEKAQKTIKFFREKLTLKKLNKLESEVTECFRYLLHKTDLVHRVAIDTKSFSLSIFDPQGEPLPKHRLSAGEKQLLAIAFLWGLARVSGRQLPVAIDTPLGRLDSSHRQNLIERYFPSASHQVILLSTDTEIAETEVTNLRKQEAIAREYLLKYDAAKGQTIVEPGYFW